MEAAWVGRNGVGPRRAEGWHVGAVAAVRAIQKAHRENLLPRYTTATEAVYATIASMPAHPGVVGERTNGIHNR